MNSNMEKPYVVGIDIGGTNTVFGIVDVRELLLQAVPSKPELMRTSMIT